MKTKELLQERPFPPFIKNHKILNSSKEIKKVFPELGLVNCSEEVEINNSNEAKKSAIELLSVVGREFTKCIKSIDNTNKKTNELLNFKTLLTSLKNSLRNKNQFIKLENSRVKISLSKNYENDDGKVIFKSGESFFKVYSKLHSIATANKLTLPQMEKLNAFKYFSSQNIPGVKNKIVFSSNEIDGVWDLATMSMRGITSCQTWTKTHKKCLIGSISDPFTGIIYLTSGKTYNNYGSKMLRRCIVRFVISDNNPLICIEKMYPEYDVSVLTAFKSFIRKKLNENGFQSIPVQYYDALHYKDKYIPQSNIIRRLDENEKSYRDSGATYRNCDFDTNAFYINNTIELFYNASSKIRSMYSEFIKDDRYGYRADYIVEDLRKKLLKYDVSKAKSSLDVLNFCIKTMKTKIFLKKAQARALYYHQSNDLEIKHNTKLFLDKFAEFLTDKIKENKFKTLNLQTTLPFYSKYLY